LQIQLLSNQVITKTNKAGKPMQVLEVAYKNLTFQGKVESKQLFDFGVQKGAFQALTVGQTGQVYEVTVVKNDAGFNDWTQITKSDGTATAVSATSPATASNRTAMTTATPAPKSTYETPEERAKKQIYIIRQSSLSNAIDLLSVGAKSQPKVEHVIETARAFEDFVFGTSDVAATVAKDVTKSAGIEDLAEDVPY
jgi:hypothetical protein